MAGLAWAATAAPSTDVVVLEAADRAGGEIRSERAAGYLVEHAAGSLCLPAAGTSFLISTTGLAEHLVEAPREIAGRGWLSLDGRLVEAPVGRRPLLGSRLLPLGARLRALAEPLVPLGAPDADESVLRFVTRRFGRRTAPLARCLATAFAAGDAQRLSARALLPRLTELEREGSVLRAAARHRRRARKALVPPTRSFTFSGGMETLPAHLAGGLDDALRLSTPVEELTPGPSGWRLTAAGETIDAPTVVLACPPDTAAALLRPLDPELAALLAAIPRAPVATVALGYPAGALSPFRGFGLVTAPGEGLRILGAHFDSALFPDRAPPGRALVRCMLGGTLDPTAVDLSDEDLAARAVDDLCRALSVDEPPEVVAVVRAVPGIPQYEIGHLERLRAIERRLADHPGLRLLGWGYRGPGVNRVIAHAVAAARAERQ